MQAVVFLSVLLLKRVSDKGCEYQNGRPPLQTKKLQMRFTMWWQRQHCHKRAKGSRTVITAERKA
jgi:hypothetical protein